MKLSLAGSYGTLMLLLFSTAMLTACSGSCPSPDAAEKALQSIMPEKFEVKEVRSLPEVPSLCESVVMVDNKTPIIVYVDKKAKFIFSGSIIEIATKNNLTMEKQNSYKKKISTPSNKRR